MLAGRLNEPKHANAESAARHAEKSQAAFTKAVSDAELEWTSVETCEAAEQAFERLPDVAVVATDVTLSDGNWYCVLSDMLRQGIEADFYVVSPDRCDTAKFLKHGVSGVLRRPLGRETGLAFERLAAQIAR